MFPDFGDFPFLVATAPDPPLPPSQSTSASQSASDSGTTTTAAAGGAATQEEEGGDLHAPRSFGRPFSSVAIDYMPGVAHI